MAILIDDTTTVLVQGITGRAGSRHTAEMIGYGTRVVAGVTPGKGGQARSGVPVFNTVKDAVTATRAAASIVFVPPPFAADAIMEAADAGIRYCVCVTAGIPSQDMMRVKRYLRRYRAARRMVLTGPNSAGTITPGSALLGVMPADIYLPGRVGIISRSGALGYEAAAQLAEAGIGVSTAVGIGGDLISGSSFADHLARFEDDPGTDAVLMIGEAGGPQEAQAAHFVRHQMVTPVVAYIAGLSAPRGCGTGCGTGRGTGCGMGPGGAIVPAAGESAGEKAALLTAAGVTVAPDPSGMGRTVAEVLSRAGRSRRLS